MKKSFLILSIGLMLSSCGGKQEKKEAPNTEAETTISAEQVQQIEKLEQTTDQIIEKTEVLNQQLDSLLNDI